MHAIIVMIITIEKKGRTPYCHCRCLLLLPSAVAAAAAAATAAAWWRLGGWDVVVVVDVVDVVVGGMQGVHLDLFGQDPTSRAGCRGGRLLCLLLLLVVTVVAVGLCLLMVGAALSCERGGGGVQARTALERGSVRLSALLLQMPMLLLEVVHRTWRSREHHRN